MHTTEIQSKTINRIYRRFVRGFLDIVVLLELIKRPLSGYDVISLVHNRFHMLLSSGTAYSYLYALERSGLVKGEYSERKRVYMLTELGEETAKTFLYHKDKIMRLLLNLFVG